MGGISPPPNSMHRRLLQLTQSTRAGLALTVISGLLAGLLTIGQAYFVSLTVDGVFLQKQTLAQVTGWMQLILVILAARGLLTWLNETAASSMAVRIKTDLRRELFAHILALGPAYSRGERTGDLTAAAADGIEALDAYYSQYLPQLVISTLVPVSILLIVFPLDPLSGDRAAVHRAVDPLLHVHDRQGRRGADRTPIRNPQPVIRALPRQPARADHAQALRSVQSPGQEYRRRQ